MNVNEVSLQTKEVPLKRFLSLDLARGIAILMMLFVHIIHSVLDVTYLMQDDVIINQPIAALIVPVFIPFIGGLAGFFLLISSVSNMISMYRDLENGKKIRSLVFKQIIGGVLLLIFAMLCEGIIGYWGVLGDFFLNLNNPAATNWQLMLWRWNHFETIHAIAWCLIINGCVHGLLSLKENWKNRRKMIVTYIILAVVVVGLTQPIWDLFGLIGPGYPFGQFPSGHELAYPWIGTEPFWQILVSPFIAVFASPIEPLFPYLAVSFIGSIIGIVLSQPVEKINKNFSRRIFLIGTAMYIVGVFGVVFVLINIMLKTNFDVGYTINFYMSIIYHRYWTPDNIIFGGLVPAFAWLAQFLAVIGLSIMLLMFLFRLIEFRGRSHEAAKRTKILRRFGTIAFTNYNNQWIYFIAWEIIALIITREHYKQQLWLGTTLTLILTLVIYSLVLWLWEKIKYTGSLEWFIRTFTNNVIPLRRQRFDPSVKWWQKGQIDVNKVFYNAKWVNIGGSSYVAKNISTEKSTETVIDTQNEPNDSKLAFRISLVGLFSIFFFPLNIFGIFFAILARKRDGVNNHNKAALSLSIIGTIFMIGILVTLFALPIDILGLF